MRVYYDFEHNIEYNYKLKKPLVLTKKCFVKIERGLGVRWLVIPSGFASDGCSIPKIFRPIIGEPLTLEFIPAAIIHDYLVEHPQEVNYDRYRASLIFFHALINEGVCPVKAALMFLGVEIWQAISNLWEDRWI